MRTTLKPFKSNIIFYLVYLAHWHEFITFNIELKRYQTNLQAQDYCSADLD